MRIGIVGLGYVGLPLAVAFAEEGHDVVGVDVDAAQGRGAQRAASPTSRTSPPSACGPSRDRIEATTRAANLVALRRGARLRPHAADRQPRARPRPAGRAPRASLADLLQPGQLVVLESTTYPGTTRERMAPMLEESGLVAGRDFNLAFSPERVDPGRTDYTLRNTPKVVGGLTEACGDRAEALYREVCDEIVRVSTPEAAELTKLLENIFRSVNIAIVNEIAMLTDRMGIDIWEVVDAAATKPYGFMRFEPGPGMGGHCLPVDPFYLSWRAREFDMTTEFIELAGKVNQQMPYHCVAKVERVLNDAGKAVQRQPDRGVRRQLQAGRRRRARVAGAEDHGAARRARRRPRLPRPARAGAARRRAARASASTRRSTGADLAVIVTAHPGVDHDAIAERAPLVVDLRGVTRHAGARRTVLL